MTNQPLSYRGLGVGGLVDLAHAAFADEGGHVVMAESGADAEGHRCYCPRLSSGIMMWAYGVLGHITHGPPFR